MAALIASWFYIFDFVGNPLDSSPVVDFKVVIFRPVLVPIFPAHDLDSFDIMQQFEQYFIFHDSIILAKFSSFSQSSAALLSAFAAVPWSLRPIAAASSD